MKHAFAKSFVLTNVLLAASLAVGRAYAHCDGMDGPVVKAAQQALATGNVNLALIWVQANAEAEVKKAFDKTLSVRKLGSVAQELADLYFFETLVRVHRAGEGEPYTGLKPAGRDLGPAIPAADKAIEAGSAEPLAKMLTDAAGMEVRERFKTVSAHRGYTANDVAAGREYVKSYVEFLHYIEGLHAAVHGSAHGSHVEETK